MKKTHQKLIVEQIDRKLALFGPIHDITQPTTGWIKNIRTALKMSLRQLGERLKMTSQSAKEIEEREVMGTISLKSLKEVALAMDMKFVYGFVPLKGSIQIMLEKQAYEVARKIVMRTSQTMKLEDQEVGTERLEKAVRELAEEIQQEMPRYLWDLK
jgi:predicted DNA-binding mobile mystery protein A